VLAAGERIEAAAGAAQLRTLIPLNDGVVFAVFATVLVEHDGAGVAWSFQRSLAPFPVVAAALQGDGLVKHCML
jgi:hypothetical protein